MGYEPLTSAATRMLLGPDSISLKEGRATGIQCLSGTGALRVGAEFLTHIAKHSVVYSSNPTWGITNYLKYFSRYFLLTFLSCFFSLGNHSSVFLKAGFQTYRSYRYWNEAKRCLDFEGLIEDLQNAPENSVIILHVCAHNPTGVDPTQEQWIKIADLIEVD